MDKNGLIALVIGIVNSALIIGIFGALDFDFLHEVTH